eukprot:TRINITY_DN1384_c0_g1_i2.p4 TRINITY_DN1384_c0_g1~~TRINITY_DN1384_c0_g1_i2.p4  ORF type:complete len:116 (+),score=28.84 TRINITY_DN1384_c0_g1_i2:736-1083(+)
MSLIQNSVNVRLQSALAPEQVEEMWRAINGVIDLSTCDVYSYRMDPEGQFDEEGGKVWEFNYFFYNKRLGKVVLFACNARSLLADTGEAEYDDGSFPMEMDDDCIHGTGDMEEYY